MLRSFFSALILVILTNSLTPGQVSSRKIVETGTVYNGAVIEPVSSVLPVLNNFGDVAFIAWVDGKLATCVWSKGEIEWKFLRDLSLPPVAGVSSGELALTDTRLLAASLTYGDDSGHQQDVVVAGVLPEYFLLARVEQPLPGSQDLVSSVQSVAASGQSVLLSLTLARAGSPDDRYDLALLGKPGQLTAVLTEDGPSPAGGTVRGFWRIDSLNDSGFAAVDYEEVEDYGESVKIVRLSEAGPELILEGLEEIPGHPGWRIRDYTNARYCVTNRSSQILVGATLLSPEDEETHKLLLVHPDDQTISLLDPPSDWSLLWARDDRFAFHADQEVEGPGLFIGNRTDYEPVLLQYDEEGELLWDINVLLGFNSRETVLFTGRYQKYVPPAFDSLVIGQAGRYEVVATDSWTKELCLPTSRSWSGYPMLNEADQVVYMLKDDDEFAEIYLAEWNPPESTVTYNQWADHQGAGGFDEDDNRDARENGLEWGGIEHQASLVLRNESSLESASLFEGPIVEFSKNPDARFAWYEAETLGDDGQWIAENFQITADHRHTFRARLKSDAAGIVRIKVHRLRDMPESQ